MELPFQLHVGQNDHSAIAVDDWEGKQNRGQDGDSPEMHTHGDVAYHQKVSATPRAGKRWVSRVEPEVLSNSSLGVCRGSSMTRKTSRRRFLKATAATGALAGLNTAVLAQEQDAEVILLGGKVAGWQGFRLPGKATATGSANPTLNLKAGTTYTLMWENLDGVPHNFAIQDKEGNNLKVLTPLTVQSDLFSKINKTGKNQTISLNVSNGTLAQVNIGNETAGNETEKQPTVESLVEKTEILSEQGAVQGVQFTASEKMAQYICLIHPNTMVGDINIKTDGAAGNQTGNNSSV